MTGRTGRWRAGVLASLALVAVGVAGGEGTLLLAAAAPLAYAGYAAVATLPLPASVEMDRTVEPTTVPPGRPVEVTLEVYNAGDRTLADCRVIDAVPEALAVVDGSPRCGLTLAPGEAESLSYTLVARRGEYEFGSPRCRVRDGSATRVETVERAPEGDDSLTCSLDAGAPPIAAAGRSDPGRAGTDGPGRGVEFHSTREYRPGDPANRIDWRGYAKRGDLATVDYERRVSTAVVVAVDARPINDAVPAPGRPSAVERTAYAGTRALATHLASGHEVGVAVVGLDGDGPGGLCWLPPGRGPDHRARGEALLERAVEEDECDGGNVDGDGAGVDADGTDADGTDADGTEDGVARPLENQARTLVDLLPPGGQVLFLAPLLDDAPVEAVRTFAAVETPATLLSPAVLAENTVSGRFASIRRRTRLVTCQGLGVRTIDWRRGTPLQVVLDRAEPAGNGSPSAARRAPPGSATGSRGGG